MFFYSTSAALGISVAANMRMAYDFSNETLAR